MSASSTTDIHILENEAALAEAAAEELAQLIAIAVARRGRCSLVLSGGGTPRPLYRRLAQSPYRNSLPWEAIDIFWGDERCVPPDHEESNYHQARVHLLDQVPIPSANVYRIAGEMEPAAAATHYATQLRQYAPPRQQWPRFDLVLLGLGSDGHVASLFPGAMPDEELCSPVIAVQADYDGRPADRVSLTPLAFNAAQTIFFLVTGSAKADAVEATRRRLPGDPLRWPGQRIQPPLGQVIWFLDEAAGQRGNRE